MKKNRKNINAAPERWHRQTIFLLLLFVALPIALPAQKQANIWYFGHHAGLDFNGFDPVPLLNSQMNADEGVAAISDSTGKLIFYTDGVNLWNSSHIQVNVTPLSGDISSTHSATIVQDQQNPGQYFVFTTKPFSGDTASYGANYYIIRITQGGSGTIIYDYATDTGKGGLIKNTTEKFAVVPFTYSDNKIGYWFLTHEFNTNRFIKIKLDSIWSDPEYQAIGSIHQNDSIDDGTNRGAAGQMKVNDVGTQIAVAVEGGKFFELFSFNSATGMISSPMKIPAGGSEDHFAYLHRAYGVEFSPSCKFPNSFSNAGYLYGTTRDGQVYQWDLSNSSDVIQLIKNEQFLYSNPGMECGDLQLAPNGKIYVAFKNMDFLGVINSPRLEECLFEEKGARLINNDNGLGGTSSLGLPASIPTGKAPEAFYFENLCLGSTTHFYINDESLSITSRNWVITSLSGGGTVSKTAPTNDFYYQFTKPGKYRVLLIVMKGGKPLRYTRDLTINTLPTVQLIENNTKDTVQLCRGSYLELDAGPGAFYAWEVDSVNARKRTITTHDDEFYHEYRVLVTDYHGCVGWDTVVIKKEIPPTATHTSVKAFCGRHDGSATVIPNGKVEYYTFDWENYPNEKTHVLSGLNGGDYVVHVTRKSTGCTITDTIHVDELGGSSIKMLHEKDTICPGETLSLKVINASEVEWVGHPEWSGSDVSVTLDTTTVFRVNAITHDENRDCSTVVTDTIWVFPKNPPHLAGNLTPCGGNPVQLDGGENYTEWNWSDGQSGRLIWVKHDEDALVLSVKDHNQCTFTDTIGIHFLPGPSINLGRDTAVCSRNPIKLTGGTGDSYSWSTGATTQSILVDQSGDYVLTITQDGCSLSDTVHVQLNDPDKLKIESLTYTDVSCYGADNGTIRVVAGGDGLKYYYSIDDGAHYFDNQGIFENVSPNNYVVRVLEDSVCSAMHPTPVVITQPDPLVLKYCALEPSCSQCNDGEITLTISGGTPPYRILMDRVEQQNTAIQGLTAGTYIVSIIDAQLCEQSDTIELVDGMRPVITADHSEPVCSGSAVELRVSNATSAEWINPPDIQGITAIVAPKVTTRYEAKAIREDRSGFRCETLVAYTVVVNPFIKPDLGNDISQCEGDTVILDGGDYVSWAWNNGMHDRHIEITEMPDNPLILTVTDAYGCTLKDSVSVVFHPYPEVNLGEDLSVCSSNPVVLHGGVGDTYRWSSSAFSGAVYTPELSATTSGMYSLAITSLGCTAMDSMQLTILDPGSVKIKMPVVTDNTCFDGQNGSIEVQAEGASFYRYSIDNGNTYQSDHLFTHLPAGDGYHIRVWADSLCYKDWTGPVIVGQPDSIHVTYQLRSPKCESCADGKLIVKISGGTPPYQVSLSGVPVNQTIETLTAGAYTLVVTDANQCTKTIDFVLDMRNVIPNVLTTNSDGVNDRWKIPMLEYYPDAVVRVYTAAGKLVFTSDPGYPVPWDGRDKGTYLPAGTYYYLIDLGPGEERLNGYLTILR